MNILLVLVPCSLILGLGALCAFVWTLNNNQYEDLEGDSARCIFDEDPRDIKRDA